MGSSISNNWASLFPNLGAFGILFQFYSISIRHRVLLDINETLGTYEIIEKETFVNIYLSKVVTPDIISLKRLNSKYPSLSKLNHDLHLKLN